MQAMSVADEETATLVSEPSTSLRRPSPWKWALGLAVVAAIVCALRWLPVEFTARGYQTEGDALAVPVVLDGISIENSCTTENKYTYSWGTYCGPVENGQPDTSNSKGQGKFWDPEGGGVYSGEWKQGMFHGHGTYYSANGYSYVGEWKGNLMDGHGSYYWPKGSGKEKYVGEWKHNKKSGQGTMTWADGDKYEGEWKLDMRNGQGTLYVSSGAKWVGEWKDNRRTGQGTITWADGSKYIGTWKNGRMSGRGHYLANGHKSEELQKLHDSEASAVWSDWPDDWPEHQNQYYQFK